MKKTMILFYCSVISCVWSCVKDDTQPLPPYNPSPYKMDLPNWVIPMPIFANNPMTVEGVALGRKLFYEKKLSGDNSMSCGSCHVQAFGFSDPNRFSVGITNKAGNRQSMAIFNLGWNEPFFWDGRSATLEEQAHDPVINPIELNTTWAEVVKKLQADATYPELFRLAFGTSTISQDLVTKAIAQFERSIVSFNSKYDKYFYGHDTTVFTPSEKRGFNVFFREGSCLHCHDTEILASNELKNNGLENLFGDNGLGDITKKESDNGMFKVTTLRNIAFTAPYMHDGRFKTLEEVVEHYNSGVSFGSPNLSFEMQPFVGGLKLTEMQKSDLVAFLKTLSDSTLLKNKQWSNPN